MVARRQRARRRWLRWSLLAATLGLLALAIEVTGIGSGQELRLRLRDYAEVRGRIERWVNVAVGDPARLRARQEAGSAASRDASSSEASQASSSVPPSGANRFTRSRGAPSAVASGERARGPLRAGPGSGSTAETATDDSPKALDEELTWRDRRALDELVEQATRD